MNTVLFVTIIKSHLYLSGLDDMLSTTVFELLDLIKNDDDRQVVMVAYDVMADMLKDIGTPVLLRNPNDTDINMVFNQIVASVVAAFNHKVRFYDFI